MPIETQSPESVPWTQLRTWSIAAFAADAADDNPRASMIAAPRFCTVGMNAPSIQAWSLMSLAAFWPSTSALKTSGYWVAEWFPQMLIFLTAVTAFFTFWATWVSARLWSRRIIAVNCVDLSAGAFFMAMSALVLAGLPTTSTFTAR